MRSARIDVAVDHPRKVIGRCGGIVQHHLVHSLAVERVITLIDDRNAANRPRLQLEHGLLAH